jgi:hypothetical protein
MEKNQLYAGNCRLHKVAQSPRRLWNGEKPASNQERTQRNPQHNKKEPEILQSFEAGSINPLLQGLELACRRLVA